MNFHIGKTIKDLRYGKNMSQETLAKELGVSSQAVSKWETEKASPDLYLLPKIAVLFSVTVDSLFFGVSNQAGELREETRRQLEENERGWSDITHTSWSGGTFLPHFGPFTPTEDALHLFGDVRGKKVLEIACGTGESLLWMGNEKAGELWGLDISPDCIGAAERLLQEQPLNANLFVSPMEQNPGLPLHYFDIAYSVYGLGWTMDPQKTIKLIGDYLRQGGIFIFSWDNPLMQCVDAENGLYCLSRSYVEEREVDLLKKDVPLHLKNWKLSTYLNCLADCGFHIERVVEESQYSPGEKTFLEGKYYSAGKAALINPTFIVKARRL